MYHAPQSDIYEPSYLEGSHADEFIRVVEEVVENIVDGRLRQDQLLLGRNNGILIKILEDPSSIVQWFDNTGMCKTRHIVVYNMSLNCCQVFVKSYILI